MGDISCCCSRQLRLAGVQASAVGSKEGEDVTEWVRMTCCCALVSGKEAKKILLIYCLGGYFQEGKHLSLVARRDALGFVIRAMVFGVSESPLPRLSAFDSD